MHVAARSGLSAVEAASRLAADGRNEIRREHGPSVPQLLARQFNSPLIWLLAAAAALSVALGERGDAVAIVAILFLNGAIGFAQESRAEHAMAALRALTAPRARVRRDGRAMAVPAAEVVRGDTLLLEAGDLVAADARLVEAWDLLTSEAALTGESLPVEKSLAAAAPGAPLADRSDTVFMGTSVASGTGEAIVVATGMDTELGTVAHLLATARPPETPLQQRLTRVSRTLLLACLGIVVFVAIAGLLRGWAPFDVLLSAVSLAVAAAPEGLPAIITIALALAARRMASRNVLVRRLPAIETLGSVTVICADKTGTLTSGVMTVRELWGPDHDRLLFTAAACCDAELPGEGRAEVGDPTELAILRAAEQRGIRRSTIERDRPRVRVTPFSAARKSMTVERADGIRYVKGAVEVVLPECSAPAPDAPDAAAALASRGLRVLAVAAGPASGSLNLIGLLGIADPPRPDTAAAIEKARAAGITTVMVTGDHPVTAHAIAREVGMLRQDVAPEEIVHARTAPQDKLELVRRWKQRGAIVAMTGDGVNDAPALREAHIGIAMGRTGAEVTREAASLVLTDDQFSSIIAAVQEGRGVFDNIRKTLVYLLAGNTGELLLMLAAALVGFPLPLLPAQLLWINVVTDGLPALALVTEPTRAGVLRRPPRPPQAPILTASDWRSVVLIGAIEACVTLTVFASTLESGTLEQARSVAFSALVLAELLRAFAARSRTKLFWQVGAFTNVRLLAVVVASAALQLGLTHLGLARTAFGVVPLSGGQLATVIVAGLVPVSLLEIRKLVRSAS